MPLAARPTAFMVMDTGEVEAFCREHDGIAGYVVSALGQLWPFVKGMPDSLPAPFADR